MNLRNYGHRETFLLRFAPWADLQLIRTRLTERLIKISEIDGYFTDVQKQQVIEFSEGNGHVVHNTLRSRKALELTLSGLYPDQRHNDVKYLEALSEFGYYFFRTDEYLGLDI